MIIIQTKRIYEPSEKKDGYRILVDRLWPRGMKKENANIDCWMKSVAPSPSLRKWFAHDPGKWEQFSKKYREELKQPGTCDELIASIKKHSRVTLLYSARDEKHNQAIVLQQFAKEYFYDQ